MVVEETAAQTDPSSAMVYLGTLWCLGEYLTRHDRLWRKWAVVFLESLIVHVRTALAALVPSLLESKKSDNPIRTNRDEGQQELSTGERTRRKVSTRLPNKRDKTVLTAPLSEFVLDGLCHAMLSNRIRLGARLDQQGAKARSLLYM